MITLFIPTTEVDGKMQFRRKVLSHVRFEKTHTGTSSASGPRRASHFLLYIFTNQDYIPPEDFTDALPTRFWTLQVGCYVADGDRLFLPEDALRVNSFVRRDTLGAFHHWEVSGRGRLYER